MSRSAVIVASIGIAILAALAVYSSWYGADRQSVATVDEDSGIAVVDAEHMNDDVSQQGTVEEMPAVAVLTESERPNVVTYKEGKPMWELPFEQLYEHVNDLRALVDAGWGQAVLPLTRLVSECDGRRTFPSEGEIRANARSRREDLRRRAENWSEERVQSEFAQFERMLELEIEYWGRKRSACNAVTDEDVLRIMDWLELALEQRHPEFLTGYLRWDILPDDKAWRARYAERLAAFNQRFELAYLDGVYAGDLAMLDLASRLYTMQKVLPERDPYRALAFDHAANLAARRNVSMRRVFSESSRLNATGLDPRLVNEARAEGERIHDRCCTDIRIPR